MIKNSLNFINNNLLNLMVYIDMEKIYNFIIINKYLYLFIIITNIIMIFDYRFTYVMKLSIIPLFIIIGTIWLTVIDINDFGEWYKELFWYTKLLNLSFIIHTCWFNWIYIFFWYYRCEKVCWIVSRISFICSMSFVLFLLNYMHFFINHKIYLKNKFYINGNTLLTYTYLYSVVLLQIIKTIVRFFMMIHGNYSIIFMKNSELWNFSYDRLISLIKIFLFLIITFILSYYILGICRLYIVWILLFVYEFLNLFRKYLKDYDIKYKNEEPYRNWNIFRKYFLLNKYIQFFVIYIILNFKVDVELKNKDYIKFIYKFIYKTLLTYPQIEYLYMNEYESNFEHNSHFIARYILFLNNEPWIKIVKNDLDWKLLEYKKISNRNNKMIDYINDIAKIFNLTELEKQSFIKFYTVDYEKRFRNSWLERGYTEKQINKIWRGDSIVNIFNDNIS